MAIVRELSGNAGSHNSTPNVDQHNAHDNYPINKSYIVTPDDNNDLPNGITEALIVGTAGLVSILYPNGVQDLVGMAQGINRIRVKRVRATGTTAANISAAS